MEEVAVVIDMDALPLFLPLLLIFTTIFFEPRETRLENCMIQLLMVMMTSLLTVKISPRVVPNISLHNNNTHRLTATAVLFLLLVDKMKTNRCSDQHRFLLLLQFRDQLLLQQIQQVRQKRIYTIYHQIIIIKARILHHRRLP